MIGRARTMSAWSVSLPRALPDVLMVASLLIGGAAIGYFGRFWSFFYDEWGTILYRRSGGFSAFFAAHNGHLQATVVGVYRVLFATVGLVSYHPYQAVIIAVHLALAGLVYLYARPRVGSWAAILVTLPLLFLANAWQVIFWAINLGFVLPLIALVVLLLWPSPVVMLLAVAVALGSSGLGVAVAAGALVLGLSHPDRVRQVFGWAIPVAGYVIWWFAYRPSALPPASLRHVAGASATGDVGYIQFPSSNFARIPSYVLHSAKAAANALIGTQTGGWWMMLALGILILGMLVARRRLTIQAAALTLTLLVFWLEVAITRAQFASPESPAASRYLYPGAFLLVLVVVEVFAGVRLPWQALALVAVGVAFVLAADIRTLQRYRDYTRVAFAHEAALLRRAKCRPHLPADFSLDPLQAPGVTVGPYLAAVRDLGSPPGQSCQRLR